ncbi:MAG: type II secretion system protein [Pirellulales bacterium]
MTRSTRQTTWCVGRHQQRLRVMGSHTTTLPQRSGFTLVELLVVITIIGVLAALITPAVFQARRTGQISAIKAEIDLLHMAMMHYKNEYGSFPPCSSGTSSSDPAARHIRRLFPRTAAPRMSPSARPRLHGKFTRWLAGRIYKESYGSA